VAPMVAPGIGWLPDFTVPQITGSDAGDVWSCANSESAVTPVAQKQIANLPSERSEICGTPKSDAIRLSIRLNQFTISQLMVALKLVLNITGVGWAVKL
jgi:hypothetical protein